MAQPTAQRSASSPVAWARLGTASRLIARSLPTLAPPILVLSLPRSGSSWLGGTLGQAANALYLREPINQTRLAQMTKPDSLVEVDPAAPLATYREAGTAAFLGLPAFPLSVVKRPDQWRLSQRTRRRLVIKEINPLASAYLLERFKPRLIFLLRHPAAIALSYIDRNWWRPEWSSWEEIGQRFGAALERAFTSVRSYADGRIVTYEELCLDPPACYRSLFEFAGLKWGPGVEAHIRRESSRGDRSDPYATSRESRAMSRDWARRMEPGALEQLRAGFAAFNLPWYQAEADWRVDAP